MKKRIISAILLTFVAIVAFIPAIGLTASAEDTTVAFTFGANGSASHNDGSSKTSYSETANGYTLSITGGTNMYTGARDAKGNSCIKLGASSKAGSFSFKVPDDVTSVQIYAAKYKSNTSKLTVNETSYTLTKNSNDGAYDVITVDTSSTKTVSVTTVSGGYRVMVNTIVFVVSSDCSHTNTTTTTVDATCTEAGSTTVTCNDCGETVSTTPIAATGHQNINEITEEATCTEAGTATLTCTVCGDTSTETIPALGHNYVDGVCSVCGAEQPAEGDATLTFDTTSKRTEYSTSVQVWEENGIKFTNNKGSSTSNIGNFANPVRLYKSSTITIEHSGMTQIVFACTSADYATALESSITSGTVSSSDNNVTVVFNEPADTFTITLSGGQVRITSLTVTYNNTAVPEPSCEHTNTTTATVDATCTEAGSTTVTCNDCGETLSTEEIPSLGHTETSEIKKHPTCTEKGQTLYTCSVCGYERTEQILTIPHTYGDDNICTECGYTDPGSLDFSGRYYFGGKRTNDTNYMYISSTLTGSNTIRYALVDSGLTSLPRGVLSSEISGTEALIFVVEKNEDGTYCIYAENVTDDARYLGWESDNSGIFVEKEAAKNLTIEKTLDGLFNIYFNDGTANRYLSLNSTANNKYAAWYKSGQIKNLTLVKISDNGFMSGASLNVGADLSIRYHAIIGGGNSINDYTVRFTMNDKEVIVSGVVEGDKLVFSFCGIAPQLMGDSIKAELILNGEVIDTIEKYSVKQYVIGAFALYPDYTELKALLSDILYYGAQAQKYLNPNIADEDLVTYGVDGLSFSNSDFEGFEPTRNIATEDGADTTLANFTAAGVRFDYINQIFVKFTTENVENVKIMVGSTELEIISLGDNKYVAYSAGISALKFGETVSFKLIYDNNLIQTLTYTVNDYAYSKNAKPDKTTDLALALYRYGISAMAYDESKSTNP